MQIRRTAFAAFAAAGILVAATACAGGSSGTSTTTAASAKTYTATALPTILKKAEKSLGITGTVLDNSQVQAQIQKIGGSSALSKLLAQPGSSISPASCKSLITTELSVAPPSKSIASILTYGSNAVTLSSEAGKKLPASLGSGVGPKLDKLLSSCGSMKLTVAESGQSETIALTLKKVDLTTNADTTAAVEETITVPSTTGGAGTPVTAEVVDAVDGNLLISAEAASTATAAAATSASTSDPSLKQVVNAVVAAAK